MLSAAAKVSRLKIKRSIYNCVLILDIYKKRKPMCILLEVKLKMMTRIVIILTSHLLGSIPEKEEGSGKIYNTLTAYDPTGKMIAKHRKVHLFDIDVPGKITFKVIIKKKFI